MSRHPATSGPATFSVTCLTIVPSWFNLRRNDSEGVDVARLGELERAVMEVLWARDEPLSVRAVHAALGDRGLAYTTVMTVLTRLANKGVVRRSRQGRAWLYRPAAGREAYVAELMLEALELSGDRGSALVHFANSVTSDEAYALRKALLRGESAPEAERQGEQT